MESDDKIWQNLIRLYNISDHKEFNKEFNPVCGYHSLAIRDKLIHKHFYSEYIAYESVQEAYLELMIQLKFNRDLKFESYRNLYNYVYTIAKYKAKEIERKIPKYEDLENESYLIYYPKYLNSFGGNIFREIYDGRKDIDRFIQNEVQSLKLLYLKIVEKYSYEELLAMTEYSAYNAVSLRQKVSRSLKKYKDFIKE